MKIRESKGDRLFEIIVYILLCLLLLIVTYPLIYVLSCSLSNPTAVGGGKVWLLPVDFTLSGYRRVFQEKSIMIGYEPLPVKRTVKKYKIFPASSL